MDVVAAIRSAWSARVGSAVSELWFDAGLQFECVHDRLTVCLPNAFLRERFRRRQHADLAETVQQALPRAMDIRYELREIGVPACSAGVTDNGNDASPNEASGDDGSSAAEKHSNDRSSASGKRVGRRPRRLAHVVRGQANQMALASVEMTLREPGRWSPLFLYGPPGCGKSMLLEAMLHEVRGRLQRRAVMLSAEQFTGDFLDALRGSGLPSFRRRYRDVQVLLLDDVQFFIGKVATRNELLHTLDALHRQGSQLVLSSDRAPADLVELGPELVARFSSGLLGAIDHPERDMRQAILERMSPPGLLSGDLIALLSERISGDARLLQGAVNRLTAYSQVLGRPPQTAEAEAALEDFFRSTRRRIRLPDIVQATSAVLGVETQRIESTQRNAASSHPRMLAMFLARKHTQSPLKEISGYFKKRSHSTVISACGEVRRWIDEHRAIKVPGGGSLPVQDVIRRIEARLHRA